MGKLATLPGAGATVAIVNLDEMAGAINEHHELAVMYVGQSFDHAVKAGALLIEAKKLVKHGEWAKWLKANVKVGARQASNYMRVASCPDEKRSAVADLSLRKAIHELALHEVRERPPAVGRMLTDSEPEPNDGDELPNTGCNYDPADPRGEDESDNDATIRRRAWLNMAAGALDDTDSFLAKHGHRAVANADVSEIDGEVMTAVWGAYRAWGRVHRLLAEKRRSTLAQDGRSEDGMDDPAPQKSSELFAKLEAELKKGGAHG